MTHGDPKNPKKNPHPVKRYEVTATADAPGPWDAVSGTVFFDVINKECVPRDSFTGGQNVPNTGYNFEMIRVDDKTWKGYFYRDALIDEDYFGQGLCHWDETGAGARFIAHGISFNSNDLLSVFLGEGQQVNYFKKNFYTDHSSSITSVPGFSSVNPQFVQNPEAFFSITVNVKESTP